MARPHARPHHALVRLLRRALRTGRGDDPRRPRLRLPPAARRDQAPAGPPRAHWRGAAQPLPRPRARREPRALREDARRLLPAGRGYAAHEGRPGPREPEHVGPGGLPRGGRAAPAHGRALARVPELRLHALRGGQSRGHRRVLLHVGVRGFSAFFRFLSILCFRGFMVFSCFSSSLGLFVLPAFGLFLCFLWIFTFYMCAKINTSKIVKVANFPIL